MAQSESILLVEDDRGLRELLTEELESEGYRVIACADTREALQALNEDPPDLLISDLRLPDASGLTLLPVATQADPAPAVLIITAFGSVQQAVEALKAGADDFLTKPLEMDHFLLTVTRLLDNRRLKSEVRQYRSLLAMEQFNGIIGQSPAMQQLFHHIRQIAPADGPVLVQGESGTGKELVARALHEQSPRRDRPYMVVNCGGIPAELMESEFFGHAAGAFTGARNQRAGLFQQADGGTLLLDELGEMPLALQAKLLRALQDGHVRPVGSDHEIQLDVRVIGATNRNLTEAVSVRTCFTGLKPSLYRCLRCAVAETMCCYWRSSFSPASMHASSRQSAASPTIHCRYCCIMASPAMYESCKTRSNGPPRSVTAR